MDVVGELKDPHELEPPHEAQLVSKPAKKQNRRRSSGRKRGHPEKSQGGKQKRKSHTLPPDLGGLQQILFDVPTTSPNAPKPVAAVGEAYRRQRHVVFGLAVFVVITVGFLVAGLVLRRIHTDHLCVTNACAVYSEMLSQSINTEADPCDDLYSYVCDGNCWMVASTAILAMHKDLLARVVPEPQNFDEDKYAGIFHFRLWKDNRWVDVPVDDRLPVNEDGELLFMCSRTKDEFWSALLEKAFAKLHGGYAALEGGSGVEAMLTFTGGLSEQIDLSEPHKDFYKTLQKAFERSSLLTCSILEEEKGGKGLSVLHEYSLTGVNKVTLPDVGTVELVRLRNPWGSSEWKGPWGDKSKKWEQVSEEKKQELGLVIKTDGEFWMSMEDFLKHFQLLDICHLGPDTLSSHTTGESASKRWEMSTFEGAWVPGSNAGGGPSDMEKFATNPQYMITLEEPDDDNEDGECTVIVALLQKDRRVFEATEGMFRSIGFALYEVEDPCSCPVPLTQEYLEDNTKVAEVEEFRPSREVTKRFLLLPGNFCVIPATEEPDLAGEFLLRIYTEKKSISKEHDETPGIIEKPPAIFDVCPIDKEDDGAKPTENENEVDGGEGSKEEEEIEVDEDLKRMFNEVAGDEGKVCCESLQSLLKKVFERDGNPQEFSLDICRSMVALIDVSFPAVN
ncbi:calpain-A [Ixodes scapularis]